MHDLRTLVLLNNAACDKAKEQRIDAARFALPAFHLGMTARLARNAKAADHEPGNWIDEATSLADAIREGLADALGVNTTDVDMSADFYGAILTPIYRAFERVGERGFHTGYKVAKEG